MLVLAHIDWSIPDYGYSNNYQTSSKYFYCTPLTPRILKRYHMWCFNDKSPKAMDRELSALFCEPTSRPRRRTFFLYIGLVIVDFLLNQSHNRLLSSFGKLWYWLRYIVRVFLVLVRLKVNFDCHICTDVMYSRVLQVINCTVVYWTLLFSTLEWLTALQCTLLYCSVFYWSITNCTLLYCTVQYYICCNVISIF